MGIRKYFKKMFFLGIIILLSLGLILSFIRGNEFILYIAGSTTVQPLMLSLGQLYTDQYKIPVSVTGGGSTLGVTRLLENMTNIGAASRFPHESNEEFFSSKWKNNISTFPIALDTIIFVMNIPINENNSKSPIVLQPSVINDIYNGKITRWNQINTNLPNKVIIPINREEGSGTRDAFYNANKFYTGNISDDSKFPNYGLGASSNGQVVRDIQNTKYSLGYVSLGYIKSFFNSSGNIMQNILFPNVQENNNSILINGSLIKNQQSILDFIRNIAPKIFNSGENHYEQNAYWHPMNLIINKNSKLYKKYLFDSNNINNNSDLLNWIYNPKSVINNNTISDIILNSGYIPMYFNWYKNDSNNYFIIPGKNNIGSNETSAQSVKDWFNFMSKSDYDRSSKSLQSPWWKHWIGAGVFS